MTIIKHTAAYVILGIIAALYLIDAYATASMRIG